MQSPGTVTISEYDAEKDGVYPASEATLRIRINTESWDNTTQTWLYGIEHLSCSYLLEVKLNNEDRDETSQSSAVIPIADAFGGYLLPNDLAGKFIASDNNYSWDAWYGNDAPELVDNEVKFETWDKQFLELVWKANVSGKGRFSYAGSVGVSIDIQIKKEGDEAVFMNMLFGDVMGEWIKNSGRRIDYGDDLPDDRRIWVAYTYTALR